MKKLLVVLFLLVLNFTLKAQYPIQQNLGGDSTIIYIKGAARTVGGFINGTYTDTAAANLTRIRQYEAAQIFTTNDSAVWIRTVGAKKWVRLGSESGGSGANIYNSDGSLTGNRILSSVGHSLQFTGLSNFLVDDVVGELVLGTSATNRLRISSGFTAFLSLDADSLLMTRLPQSQLLSTDSVLVRTADFKVKTRAVSSIGSTYTAGNGLTLSGSQFKLGGTLTEPTTITGSGTNLLKLDGYTSANVGYLGIGTDFGYLRFGDGGAFSPTYENEINGGVSQIGLKTTGDIYLDAGDIYTIGVPTVSSTTGRKVALIDTATGKVERIDPATLVSTPTLQQVLTAGSTLTTNADINAGQNSVTIDSVSYLKIANGYSDSGSPGLHGDFLQLNLIAVDILQLVGGSSSIQIRDSIKLSPQLGQLNIDSLRTWSGISDTTYKKPMTWDTRNGRWEYAANWPQQKINLVFGAGSGADADTTAFTTSAIYGSFYNDADTIVVTSFKAVLQGTSPDVTYKIWYNDSLNVEAGATALNTAGNQVTSTTTGTNVTSITNTKIPPGVWVWVKTSTVATKPKYFSLTLNGYRK